MTGFDRDGNDSADDGSDKRSVDAYTEEEEFEDI